MPHVMKISEHFTRRSPTPFSLRLLPFILVFLIAWPFPVALLSTTDNEAQF